MVTARAGNELHVEVSDFGYGPAHAAIVLLEGRPDRQVTIWSSGNALELLRASLPHARFREHDSTQPHSFASFAEQVPTRAPVLTMSRPFAADAVRAGHWVCLVDQLDWMWGPHDPPAPPVALHLVPTFGSTAASTGTVGVAPLLSPVFQQPAQQPSSPSTVVVAFGGMSMMGDPTAVDRYARWLLSAVIPVLDEAETVTELIVVGGSPNLSGCLPKAYGELQVTVCRAQTPERYAGLLGRSGHQILAPGLATLVESEALGLTPLLQPGVNKSMLLQLDAVHRGGYQWTARWPWHAEAVGHVQQRPQAQGLEWLAPRLNDATGPSADAGWLAEAVRTYLARPAAHAGLRLGAPTGQPDAAELLDRALVGEACD